MKIKRLISHLVLLLLYTNCFSQSFDLEVIYKKRENSNDMLQKEKDDLYVNKLIFETNKVFNSLEYKLKANNFSSIFEEVENLQADNSNKVAKAIASNLGNTNGVYYTNIKDKFIVNQREFGGDLFRVKTMLCDVNWEISNEQRKISGYTCLKATSFFMKQTVSGEKKTQITAWFTSELSFPFGPGNYTGLPGLVLEVYVDRIVIYASKISTIKSKNLIIKEPLKGKLVTDESFKKLVQEGFSNYKSFKK